MRALTRNITKKTNKKITCKPAVITMANWINTVAFINRGECCLLINFGIFGAEIPAFWRWNAILKWCVVCFLGRMFDVHTHLSRYFINCTFPHLNNTSLGYIWREFYSFANMDRRRIIREICEFSCGRFYGIIFTIVGHKENQRILHEEASISVQCNTVSIVKHSLI